MNSKVAQYLPISGKGHGILYVNQYTKQTRLFHPNSATKQLEKPEDKNKLENLTETATDGIQLRLPLGLYHLTYRSLI